RLQRVLEPRRRVTPAADAHATAVAVERTVAAVLHRGRWFVRPRCLVRGITRYAVLRRAGVDVELCFGVGRPQRDIEGHCWLVLDNRVIFEPPDSAATFTRVV